MTTIRGIRDEDIGRLVRISKAELGVDYLDESDFVAAMEDPEQFCAVAEADGTLAGFAICRMFPPEEEPDALGLPECPERSLVLSQRRIGLLDSVAVDSRFKGEGLGTRICEASCARMESEGCTMDCAMAWKSPEGRTNISGVLTRMGFRETISIRGYWNGMVDSPEGHQCPICGAPCRCFGVFWYRLTRRYPCVHAPSF